MGTDLGQSPYLLTPGFSFPWERGHPARPVDFVRSQRGRQPICYLAPGFPIIGPNPSPPSCHRNAWALSGLQVHSVNPQNAVSWEGAQKVEMVREW
jgi:hypothetical protein